MTGGLQSSAYEVAITEAVGTITAGDPILTTDLTINKDLINGDSGQIRLMFSFTTTGEVDYNITVTKLGATDLTSPLILNADNAFILLSKGYYRFDISVAPGDLFNIRSSQEITKINDLQVQLIPIST